MDEFFPQTKAFECCVAQPLMAVAPPKVGPA